MTADQSRRPDVNRVKQRFSILRDPSLSGETDDPVADHDANRTLEHFVSAEAFVEDYYTRKAPGFLAAHLAVSCLPELEHIIEQAFQHDHQDYTSTGIDDAGFRVIVTSRPGQHWTVSDRTSFDAVLQEVSADIWCDLAGPDRYCIGEMQFVQRNMTGYVDDRGKMLNRSFSFPFDYMGTVVVARVCVNCWVKFVREHKIKGVRIQNPYDCVQ